MDKKGLTYQKKMDIVAVYDRLRSTEGINMNLVPRSSLVDLVANEPAPRFYLEPRTIEHMVMRYIKGIKTPLPERTEDLYQAYCRVKEEHPHAKMDEIWYLTSLQPAKSFYTSKRTIRDFIFGWR